MYLYFRDKFAQMLKHKAEIIYSFKGAVLTKEYLLRVVYQLIKIIKDLCFYSFRGVQLVERNEELCIYYERLNVQDQMIKKGMLELTAREEDVKFLNTQLTEEKRQVDQLKKRVPGKRSLERELATLQIQVN